MKRTLRMNMARINRSARIVLPLFAAVLCASTVWAQPPGGPGGPPPGGGPGGPGFGGPGGPPGGPGGMGAPRPSATIDIPMPMLEAGLNLTADQKAQIAPIQRAFRSQRPSRGGFPPPPGSQGGPGGGPPNGGPPDGPPNGGPPNGGFPDGGPSSGGPPQDGMRNAAQQQASKKIEAILTPDQKQALPALLKELDALRGVGIPADLYGQLKLTSDQKTRIATIAQKMQQKMRADMDSARQSGDFQSLRGVSQQTRKQAHDDALAVLTSAQQQLVQQQPRNRPPGGPNGGPPPPGGPNGGPPPPGGDGPPPAP